MTIYPYGLALAGAVLAGWLLLSRQAEQAGLKSGTAAWAALIMIPLGVLFARAGYWLVSWSRVTQLTVGFFDLRRGGFFLYGAMAGCALGLWITARITGESFPRLADAAAAPGALVICLSRLAENLAGTGFGRNILDWFSPWMQQSSIAWEDPSILFRFPFAMQDRYGEWNFNIAVLEALAAGVILAALLRVRTARAGGRAVLLLALYASMQAILESMRQDAVLKWGMVRVSQLLSAVAVVLALILCAAPLLREGWRPVRFLPHLLGVMVSAGVITAMEFALEQKINFLTWMRMDVCYGVMALGCAGLWLSVRPVWKAAFQSNRSDNEVNQHV